MVGFVYDLHLKTRGKYEYVQVLYLIISEIAGHGTDYTPSPKYQTAGVVTRRPEACRAKWKIPIDPLH